MKNNEIERAFEHRPWNQAGMGLNSILLIYGLAIVVIVVVLSCSKEIYNKMLLKFLFT